jgi:hypothetical protein
MPRGGEKASKADPDQGHSSLRSNAPQQHFSFET